MVQNDKIKLTSINYGNEDHIKKLFYFLNKRKFNISNTKKTDYKNHLNFVKNNPYRNWFLIEYKSNYIGSIYVLFNNGIGIDIDESNYNLIEDILDIFISIVKPLREVPSLRTSNFHINIPPENKKLIKVISNLGAIKTQSTFEFFT